MIIDVQSLGRMGMRGYGITEDVSRVAPGAMTFAPAGALAMPSAVLPTPSSVAPAVLKAAPSGPVSATPAYTPATSTTPTRPAPVQPPTAGGAGAQALIDKLRADNAKLAAGTQASQKQLVAMRDLVKKLTDQVKALQAKGGGGGSSAADKQLIEKLRGDVAKLAATVQAQQKTNATLAQQKTELMKQLAAARGGH